MKGKQELIREFVLEELRSGRLGPGMRLPSRKDLMNRFDCARATVDTVVEHLKSAGLLTGKKGAGTYAVRKNRPGRRREIALLSPGLSENPMAQQIILGLMESLGSGEQTRFFSYAEVRTPKAWEICKEHKALLFVMPDTPEASLLMDSRRNGLKHLVIYRDIPESSFVSIDNRGGVTALVRALKKKGCQRIAYWGAPHSRYHFSEERYIGYLEGLHEEKIVFDRHLAVFLPEKDEAATLPVLLEHLRKGPKPAALLCENRPIGKLISLCEKMKTRIGEDFLLANFDPVPAGHYPFPILSLLPVVHEVGRAASEVLPDIIRDPGRIIQRYLLPSITEI